MTDTRYNAPLFGISINPTAKNVQHAFKLAQVADSTGLDFITIQDHPYPIARLKAPQFIDGGERRFPLLGRGTIKREQML